MKMSAKLIYSLTDNENPDLHKQIGCMNGFFQLFDRHRRIAGHGRIANAQLQPGQTGKQAIEAKNGLEKAKEKDSNKAVKEKRKSSTDSSSRHSFSSSSCSSSFSSLDYNNTNKPANPEPSPSRQNTSSSSAPSSRKLPADRSTRRSVDLRDVVKDSMHREARGLSVKTAPKESSAHSLKYVDSPRPMEVLKPSKPRSSGGGANDSLWAPRDLRRLSYDGRESQDSLKSSARIRELPRLSLDSRAAKPYLLSDLRIEKRSPSEAASLLQEPGSSKRASSVVAKLMGLVDPVPVPVADEPRRLDNALGPEKSASKDLSVRKADSVTRASAGQKFPIETAPWRQQQNGGGRGPQPPGFKFQEAPAKVVTTTPLTVFGEIEKRLADLEFKKSGKDLRALKQILEAMQKSKVILADKNDSKLAPQESQRSPPQSNGLNPLVAKGSNARSPIVIMKPAKLLGRHAADSAPAVTSIDHRKHDYSADHRKAAVDRRTTTKHVMPRNSQVTNPNTRAANLALAQKMADGEENAGNSGRIIPGATSPRLQPKRPVGSDKQSYAVDSNIRRKQNGRQSPESSSPGRKFRPRSSGDRSSENFSRQGNASPLQSESNVSLASEDIDCEVTSIIQVNTNHTMPLVQNPTAGLDANGKVATAEQPSPISVLDATFYRDESPSPVKKTSSAFKDDDIPYPDDLEWAMMDLDPQSNGRKSMDSDKFFCESTNPDHIYISDILSASDLPRDLRTTDRRPIDPKLFSALERRRAGLLRRADERVHRRLVFDVVNEILVRRADKPARGKQLLEELCSEVDRLQGGEEEDDDDEEERLRSIVCEDMARWPMNRREYGKEVPAVVLDVERLIFKDLVTELVAGGLKSRPGGHCKQLHFK